MLVTKKENTLTLLNQQNFLNLNYKKLTLILLSDGAPARIRTADLLITNQESKFKKINTINVNLNFIQICTHYRHSGIFFYE